MYLVPSDVFKRLYMSSHPLHVDCQSAKTHPSSRLITSQTRSQPPVPEHACLLSPQCYLAPSCGGFVKRTSSEPFPTTTDLEQRSRGTSFPPSTDP